MGSHLKKVGFLGGSFDPIHLGHLNLAIELLEKCQLDRVLLCPAHISPTKQDRPPVASPEARLAMARIVANEVPQIEVTEIELSRPPPSYTVDTIELLSKRENSQFHLLLAQDAILDIDQWKGIETLLNLAPPYIGTRHGFRPQNMDHFPADVKLKIEQGMVQIEAVDISSTIVRERLKKKLYCGHLLPRKVLDYIYDNGLYYTS